MIALATAPEISQFSWTLVSPLKTSKRGPGQQLALKAGKIMKLHHPPIEQNHKQNKRRRGDVYIEFKIKVGRCRKVVVVRFDFAQDHWSKFLNPHDSILIQDRMGFQKKITGMPGYAQFSQKYV